MDLGSESCKVRYGQPLLLQGGMVVLIVCRFLYLRIRLLTKIYS